jgi:hypothetical protein
MTLRRVLAAVAAIAALAAAGVLASLPATPARAGDITYPNLTAQTTVQDTDLLATWRASGPLTKVNASVLAAYVQTKLGSAYVQSANNLSDLASITAARANLGLGSAALASTGTSGTALCQLNFNCVVSGTRQFNATSTFDAAVQVNSTFGVTGSATFGVGLTSYSNVAISNTVSSNIRYLTYNTSGSPRWAIGEDTTSESGGNAGSNLIVTRSSDSGTYIDTPLTINRATGLVALADGLTVNNVIATFNYGAWVAGGNLTVNEPSSASGANVVLIGNGTTTPTKFIRVVGGLYQIMNSAYSSAIWSMDDAGDVTNYGSLTVNGAIAGSLTGNAATASAWQTARTETCGGDMTGGTASVSGAASWTLPCTLQTTGITAGTYGTSTTIPVLTFDAKGRATGASTVAIGNAPTATALQTGQTIGASGDVGCPGVSFNGTAGVALTCTLATSGVTAGTYGDSGHAAQVTVDAKGRVTGASSVAISYPNQLTPTGVTSGTYGDSGHVAQVAVGADGRVTGASSVAISYPNAAQLMATLGLGSIGGGQIGSVTIPTPNGNVIINWGFFSSMGAGGSNTATFSTPYTSGSVGIATGTANACGASVISNTQITIHNAASGVQNCTWISIGT